MSCTGVESNTLQTGKFTPLHFSVFSANLWSILSLQKYLVHINSGPVHEPEYLQIGQQLTVRHIMVITQRETERERDGRTDKDTHPPLDTMRLTLIL